MSVKNYGPWPCTRYACNLQPVCGANGCGVDGANRVLIRSGGKVSAESHRVRSLLLTA